MLRNQSSISTTSVRFLNGINKQQETDSRTFDSKNVEVIFAEQELPVEGLSSEFIHRVE
jgi:hypothetical protein